MRDVDFGTLGDNYNIGYEDLHRKIRKAIESTTTKEN